MALVEVGCPLCKTKTVANFGLNRQGKQRYPFIVMKNKVIKNQGLLLQEYS